MSVTPIRSNAATLANKAPRAKAISRSTYKRLRRQVLAGTAVCAVAVTLTGLSLTHLAHGIEIVTRVPAWESWAMAIGVDVSFIALECASMVATSDKLVKAISRYTRPTIYGTLGASAALNALAFASQTTGWFIAPAIMLGIAVPALIYALTRVGAAMYMDGRVR